MVVAAAGVRCPTSVAEVCFEWVKLTSTGLRVSFQVTAADPVNVATHPRCERLSRSGSVDTNWPTPPVSEVKAVRRP